MRYVITYFTGVLITLSVFVSYIVGVTRGEFFYNILTTLFYPAYFLTGLGYGYYADWSYVGEKDFGFFILFTLFSCIYAGIVAMFLTWVATKLLYK